MGRKYNPVISSARTVWRKTYNDSDVSFEIFYQLSQQPCYYCGLAPYRSYSRVEKNSSLRQKIDGIFIYNGLDRLDSAKGHTINNVVPCCTTCNYMKLAMAHDSFLSHISLIYCKLDHAPTYKNNIVLPICSGNTMGPKGGAVRKYHPIVSSAKVVWHKSYKDGGIDFDTFYILSQQDCIYCHRPPHTTYRRSHNRKDISEYQKKNGDFIYNGLDRIDSNKSHLIDKCCYVLLHV